MIVFIDDDGRSYRVEPICKGMPITPSTYRAHVARRSDPTRLAAYAQRELILTGDI